MPQDDEAWPQRPASEPTAGLLGWPARPPAPTAAPPEDAALAPQDVPAAVLGPLSPPPAPPPTATGPRPHIDPKRRVLALGIGCAVLAFLLTAAVLAAVSRRGGDGSSSTTLPTQPDTIPPGLTVPTTATTLPATRDPGVVACSLLTPEEASAALGEPVVNVAPYPQVVAAAAPSCGFFTAGRPGPGVARVVVASVDAIQYAFYGRGAGVLAPPVGPATFAVVIAGTPFVEARSGAIDESKGVVLQVFGSKATDAGKAQAERLAELARGRR